jgi:HSP20 family protein
MLARIDNSLARRDSLDNIFDPWFRSVIDPWFVKQPRRFYGLPSFEYTDDRAVLMLDLPGIKKDDLNVSITEGVVSVSGKRGKREFSGEYTLDASYDPSTANAELEDGVLTLTFDRLPETKPRKIEVKVR